MYLWLSKPISFFKRIKVIIIIIIIIIISRSEQWRKLDSGGPDIIKPLKSKKQTSDREKGIKRAKWKQTRWLAGHCTDKSISGCAQATHDGLKMKFSLVILIWSWPFIFMTNKNSVVATWGRRISCFLHVHTIFSAILQNFSTLESVAIVFRDARPPGIKSQCNCKVCFCLIAMRNVVYLLRLGNELRKRNLVLKVHLHDAITCIRNLTL